MTPMRIDAIVEDTPGTRERIQEVALELFTEHGYEATSLREIAERLGVTKAALYYHFKTKDDIVTSFMEDRAAAVEEIVAWGKAQPPTADTRQPRQRHGGPGAGGGGDPRVGAGPAPHGRDAPGDTAPVRRDDGPQHPSQG